MLKKKTLPILHHCLGYSHHHKRKKNRKKREMGGEDGIGKEKISTQSQKIQFPSHLIESLVGRGR